MVEWRSVVGWGEKKREKEGERTRWKNGLMKEIEEGWDGGVEVGSRIGEEGKKEKMRGKGGKTGADEGE